MSYSTVINTRSPYFIKYSAGTNQFTSVQVDITIWEGDKRFPPSEITYTITKTPLENVTGNFVVYEVSELIRDFLQTEYYTEAVDAVWVKVDSTQTFTTGSPVTTTDTYLGLDGFGYFEDGANPRNGDLKTPMVMQSNHCINVVNGRDIRIPVFSEFTPRVTTSITSGVWNDEDDYWETATQYWNDTGTDLQLGDSFESNQKIQYVIIDTENAQTGDTITFTGSDVVGEVTTVITINVICEPRFEQYRSIFYNKFGALQSYWFTQKSGITTSTKSEMFKRNTLDFTGTDVSYSVYKHNKQRFNVTADQAIQLNTPLQEDCLNEPLEQMIMSEYIWLEDSSSTTPVLIKTESIKRMTGVNDKMIRYTVDFEYAYSKINTVR